MLIPAREAIPTNASRELSIQPVRIQSSTNGNKNRYLGLVPIYLPQIHVAIGH